MAHPDVSGWKTVDDVQSSFFRRYGSAFEDLDGLDAYLSAIHTHDAAALNAWFAERGFPAMNVNIPAGGSAIGSVFDLLVDWQVPGKKKSLYVDRNMYQGVQMTASNSMRAWNLDGHVYPMFELATAGSDGWRVYLVETDQVPLDLLAPSRASKLLRLERSSADVSKLEFPSVEMAMDVDVSFLKGMEAPGFRIDEAIKKVKLRLDDKGARAQSAVAYTMRGIERGVYTIDKPFFVIFHREGLNLPPFVAIAGKEHWVKPEQTRRSVR